MPGPPPPVSASRWQSRGPHMCGPYNLPGKNIPGQPVGAAYMPPAMLTTTQTKKLLQRLKNAAGAFPIRSLFPFQPEHLELPVSVGLVLVEFLGLDVALEGTVKLQGVPVLLNVGQHAGNGGFLALKLRFAVP